MRASFFMGIVIAIFLLPTMLFGVSAQYGLDDALKDAGVPNIENLPTFGLDERKTDEPPAIMSPVQAAESVLLNFVVNPIFFIAGGVAVVMLIFYAARLFLFSGINEEAIEAGKKNILWIFVGLLLIVGSYTIVRNIILLVIERLGTGTG